MTTNRWTLSEIKAANTASGGYFFAPATMKGFGDAMSSFKVANDDDGVYIVRVRDARHKPACVKSEIGKRYKFDPTTGSIRSL